MIKPFLILGIITILVCVGLNGCINQTSTEDNDNTNTEPVEEPGHSSAFIGRWGGYPGSYIWEFSEDGTMRVIDGYYEGKVGTEEKTLTTIWNWSWKVINGELHIIHSDGFNMIYTYSIINEDKIYISLVYDGDSGYLIREV